MRRFYFFFLLITGFVLTGCLPAEEHHSLQTELDFSNSEIQAVQTAIEKRNFNKQLDLLRSSNPNIRLLTLRSIASNTNGVIIDSIASYVNDEVDAVRHMAVFALGQTRDQQAVPYLIQAFQKDSLDFITKKHALEAVGKTGDIELLKYVAGVTTYQISDTALLIGQTRSIYQFMLRNLTDTLGHARMNSILEDQEYPSAARFMAATYFGRLRNVNLDKYSTTFSQALKDEDPNIRMFAALAFKNVNRSEYSNTILSALRADLDDRVKINLIRALDKSDYKVVKPTLLDIMPSSTQSLQVSIAQYLKQFGTGADMNTYNKLARGDYPAEVRAICYAASLKNIGRRYTDYKDRVVDSLRLELRKTDDRFEKAFFISALGEYPSQYPRLARYMSTDEEPIIRSTAMAALASIRSMPNLKRLEGDKYERTIRKFDGIIRSAFTGGDPAVIAIAAGLIRNPKLDFKERIRSTNFIEEARANLKSPEHLETIIEIEKTLAYLNGSEEKSIQHEFVNGANYGILTRFNSNPKALITVDNKKIELELYSLVAPVSVSNFIQLAEDDFFDGKVFHRVVPNFVIQGGCPRGDGYGSLNYTIPTEVGLINYDRAGRLGMASAGTDTECSQFFITHSPTPHLDGRYTIFGQVTKGLEFVQEISTAAVIQDVVIFE